MRVRRRSSWFVLSLVASLPALAGAQDCYDCRLGVYDDPALTLTKGTIETFEPKDVYIGLKVSGDVDRVSGAEFSVVGLQAPGLFVLGAHPLGPRALVWGGTLAAPVDTSLSSTGDGGVTVSWSSCLEGDVALFRVVLYATEDLSDHVLTIMRSFPTTNPNWRMPILTRCDPPSFTASRVSSGCYVLNATGAPIECILAQEAVAVEPRSWSAVKQFYR